MLDRVTDVLMSKGFLVKRRGDGRIEAELGDERILIDPLAKAWIYMRGEGKGVLARAFFSLDGIIEKLDNLRG